jgi:hypothetical protein
LLLRCVYHQQAPRMHAHTAALLGATTVGRVEGLLQHPSEGLLFLRARAGQTHFSSL